MERRNLMFAPRSTVIASAILFLAATSTIGQTMPTAICNDNRVPAGSLASGVLNVHLEARPAIWYPNEAGKTSLVVSAFAEEGRKPQIPGPLLRVMAGLEISATVRNSLDHTIYVHGLASRPDTDSQPTSPADPTTTADAADTLEIPVGAVKQVRFKSGAVGSYYYWASNDRQSLLMRNGPDSMLSGAFIVDPPGARNDDRVFVVNTWVPVGGNAFNTLPTINGKSWPDTERIGLKIGEAVRWRWINASDSDHSMHLHGFYFQVSGVGDQSHFQQFAPPEQLSVVTQEMLPGGTFDMTWIPERPGHWLMHCHMTFHMMQPENLPGYSASSHYTQANAGMGGVVLGLDVQPSSNLESTPAKATPSPVAAHKFRLLVRERPATSRYFAGFGYDLISAPADTTAHELPPVGSPLVLTRGEPAEIEIVNKLKEPTTVHWHGIELDSPYDGVPDWSGMGKQATPPIAPGGSYIARMTPPRAGTFIYHSHWHEQKQLGEGLTGPLIVLEPGAKFDPATDKTFLFSRDGVQSNEPLLMNGNSQPPPIAMVAGTAYRMRFINITPVDSDLSYSIVDAAGAPVSWRPIAKDGKDLPPQQAGTKSASGDTITVGETRDYLFTPQKEGELYLQAASFQRMWVKTTLIVSPQALRPVASPSATLLDQWNEISRKLIAMAEDFPEEKYDYKPATNMRSFAERLIHAAAANYFFINSALGQPLPGDEDPPRAQFKNKAAVVEYVKKSFADGAAAIKSKGDAGISGLVIDPFGYDDPQHASKAQIRLSDLAHNIIEHSGEVYGQLSAYYRVSGLIPPESRPKK
jgi:FtsP/CotA-like multicopper oxidase with cupredoxin domain